MPEDVTEPAVGVDGGSEVAWGREQGRRGGPGAVALLPVATPTVVFEDGGTAVRKGSHVLKSAGAGNIGAGPVAGATVLE